MDESLITTFDDLKEKYKINEIYTVPTYISFAELIQHPLHRNINKRQGLVLL